MVLLASLEFGELIKSKAPLPPEPGSGKPAAAVGPGTRSRST